METKYLYNAGYFRKARKHQANANKLNLMHNIIMEHKPSSVLDIGCGVGYLVDKLREGGISAYGTDFSPHLSGYWGEDKPYLQVAEAYAQPFEDKSFDIVVSTDFFEHVPEEDIDRVYAEMNRVGKKVIAFIASEEKLSVRQALFHVTNKPISWWKKRLPGCIVYDSRDYYDRLR